MGIVDPIEANATDIAFADGVETLRVVHKLTGGVDVLLLLRQGPLQQAGIGILSLRRIASPPSEIHRCANRVRIGAEVSDLFVRSRFDRRLEPLYDGRVGRSGLLDNVREEERGQPAVGSE
jgi:hypothetical protein